VGNYRTYEEAHQMLISLRKQCFTQATIVKGKITVQY
jgi:translation initiation factor 1 (eIF-1/SUI1)